MEVLPFQYEMTCYRISLVVVVLLLLLFFSFTNISVMRCVCEPLAKTCYVIHDKFLWSRINLVVLVASSGYKCIIRLVAIRDRN